MTVDSQSLAVRYRPQVLEDLVGQDAVATQVLGMLKTGRFPSTIGLFGESGAGKTTVSRMIARYINCLKPDKKTYTPCGECPSCIYGNDHPDVHEMNMAETRGIDDVRSMIQASRSMPTLSKKRVFILDEMHACFPGNTFVRLADGTYRTMIEIGAMMKAGQDVYVEAYNFDTEQDEAKLVTHFLPQKSKPRRMVRITFWDQTYQDCTEDHKWWSKTRADWVEAKDLERQEELASPVLLPFQQHVHSVAPLEFGEEYADEEIDVYDLTVADHHNYYVRPVGLHYPLRVSNCTPQAFQALLKPLEEPPAHTVWFLATTNPEKLPSTILGRTHRFNIKPIDKAEIVKRLVTVGRGEGVRFKKMEGGLEILDAIAELSNGRMRDSIVMLESVLFAIASGKKFTSKELIKQFARSPDADMDVLAAEFLVAVNMGKMKEAVSIVLRAGNVRQLIMKTRWLTQSLIAAACGTNYFKTYAYRCFAELSKKAGTGVKLPLLIRVQSMLCELEIRLNSVSIDEAVQASSYIGQFVLDQKSAA